MVEDVGREVILVGYIKMKGRVLTSLGRNSFSTIGISNADSEGEAEGEVEVMGADRRVLEEGE